MAATQDSVTCAVCMEVYRSPRFLPCYHSFCLPCLEELANKHGKIIRCPTCRAPATVPPGGVCDLQVNFYFTEEALEEVRNEKSQSRCPVHTKECVIFYCTQCDQAICIRCKLTKHEGHTTEDLSEKVARCKKTIEDKLQSIMANISLGKDKLEFCRQNEKGALEKRAAVRKQVLQMMETFQSRAGEMIGLMEGDLTNYSLQCIERQDRMTDRLEREKEAERLDRKEEAERLARERAGDRLEREGDMTRLEEYIPELPMFQEDSDDIDAYI
ncbi:hypothetical protein C0Q70_03443 [Pomacea canaliculata]|uniref:RING-type domain-containing protein n=1 Tax=Pomacea canaliculata TaxID=400727 RepID=A0A2T7PSR4_POMCA|nr:hypothetical protein C0Q70_03443 [Pomacea canaliculata]